MKFNKPAPTPQKKEQETEVVVAVWNRPISSSSSGIQMLATHCSIVYMFSSVVHSKHIYTYLSICLSICSIYLSVRPWCVRPSIPSVNLQPLLSNSLSSFLPPSLPLSLSIFQMCTVHIHTVFQTNSST